MIGSRHIRYFITITTWFVFIHVDASQLNDKILFNQQADNRSWHLGFGVGLHLQELAITNNGYITPDNENWVVENNSYSPGFNLCGLVDFKLSNFFNLRLSPGLMFGNRNLFMRELGDGETMKHSIKSVYLLCPFELKYSAIRFHNVKPYIVGGIIPAADVNRRRGEVVALKCFDLLASIGFGCDIYMPYFKLNPELKFCYGLTDAIQHNRQDLNDDESIKITQSIKRGITSMIVLTFYFE